MERPKKLHEHIGKNEKTKIVAKLTSKGAGAPVRYHCRSISPFTGCVAPGRVGHAGARAGCDEGAAERHDAILLQKAGGVQGFMLAQK
jgi:hypothetical protein